MKHWTVVKEAEAKVAISVPIGTRIDWTSAKLVLEDALTAYYAKLRLIFDEILMYRKKSGADVNLPEMVVVS